MERSISGGGIRLAGAKGKHQQGKSSLSKKRKKWVKGCTKKAEEDEFWSFAGLKKAATMDLVRHRSGYGQDYRFCLRAAHRRCVLKIPALIKTSRHSRKAVVLRGVGSVSALFSGSKTIHRQGEHLANRTQKPGLPHPNQALATENPMFFQKGGHARYDYRTFY